MIVDVCVSNLSNLYRLTGREVIRLAPGHALVGVDGWADGLAGTGSNTPARINDWFHIESHEMAKGQDPVRKMDNGSPEVPKSPTSA
jgi:hypothetical protein